MKRIKEIIVPLVIVEAWKSRVSGPQLHELHCVGRPEALDALRTTPHHTYMTQVTNHDHFSRYLKNTRSPYDLGSCMKKEPGVEGNLRY